MGRPDGNGGSRCGGSGCGPACLMRGMDAPGGQTVKSDLSGPHVCRYYYTTLRYRPFICPLFPLLSLLDVVSLD